MQITVNNKLIKLKNSITIMQFLTDMKLTSLGSALAINNIVIPRENWGSHYINNKDIILLFEAIAGG